MCAKTQQLNIKEGFEGVVVEKMGGLYIIDGTSKLIL